MTRSRWLYALGIAVSLAGFGVALLHARASTGAEADAIRCEKSTDPEECFLRLISEEFNDGGMDAARRAFGLAYGRDSDFAKNCHSFAHYIGDLTYAEVARGNLTVDGIDLSLAPRDCHNGFFHGFFEHLAENNRDPQFVTDICSSVRDRFSSEIPNIASLCYHAAGHGFALARLGDGNAAHDDPRSLLIEPMRECGPLPAEAIPHCEDGVMVTMAQFIAKYQPLPHRSLYHFCDGEPDSWKYACYRAFGQVTPLQDLALVSHLGDYIADTSHRRRLIEGVMTNVAQQPDASSTTALLEACASLPAKFYAACGDGVAQGIVENLLEPDRQRTLDAFCPMVEGKGIRFCPN